MTVTLTNCPDCGERVAVPDNGVRLDYPAVKRATSPDADWWIMDLGSMHLACAGGPDAEKQTLAHTLHAHQPAEVE